jgi:asparagine synthetase B (glutamine-hydrolysing)
MCSFLYTNNYKDQTLEDLNFFLKFRGPDHTQVKQFDKNFFVHNLLSITGQFTPQPYEENGIYMVYNGEIYNYKSFGDYNTDGECIIPLYKEFGSSFVKKLDGEFAICLIDTHKQVAILSTDIFKTKPLFFSTDKNSISCASYKTPLQILGCTNIQTASPNTTYTFCLKTAKLISKDPVYKFDLIQHKTSYDDWISAFKNAIKKRCDNTEKKIFIGLSSGYDSGLIFSELLNQNFNFTSFTLRGTENDEIIDSRLKLKNSFSKCYSLHKNDQDYYYSHNIINKNTEPFFYTIHSSSSNYNEFNTRLVDDGGSNNFATICRAAKQVDCKICLSGTGADEIISDYGFNGNKFYNHSNFGGKFPENLETIFPWASFYGSTLESYIAKEEYVGGSFGIEMRYPFLDKDVVQEFLWLHQDLKNKEYKAPIDYYFRCNNIPYAKQEKKGF